MDIIMESVYALIGHDGVLFVGVFIIAALTIVLIMKAKGGSSNHSTSNNRNVLSRKTNLYVEYRKWVFFWGLFIDGEEEVQEVLNKYNSAGWNCVQFEWSSSWKIGLFKTLLIWIVMLLTLGFVNYWMGFSIVFERDLVPEKEKNENNSKVDASGYAEWKKSNPGKSLNDFYADFKSIKSEDTT